MSDSVAVDAAAPLTFGGTVQTVLETPRSTPPPQTLEEARNQPGRRERIETITKRIEAEGIKYVFFQQVSITGRVMGKGVVADFFPQVAEKGYQLVYGATANLFVDRVGDYIGFGPEESELAAIADLDTFAPLPWDPRVARVLCDCYDTETGELLDADPRQNLKRVVSEFEEELGYSFLIGIEPEMMWLKRPEDGSVPGGVTKPYCYHIHQFEELRPVLLDVIEYGQALGLDMSYGDHEDAPGQLELNFRFDRPSRPRTTSRPIARSAPPSAASTACCPPSCPSRSSECRRTGTTTTSRSWTTTATTSSTTPTGRRSCRRPRATSSAACSTTSAPSCAWATPPSTPTAACGTRASGRRSTRTGAGRTAPAPCGWRPAAASSTAASTRPATPT